MLDFLFYCNSYIKLTVCAFDVEMKAHSVTVSGLKLSDSPAQY